MNIKQISRKLGGFTLAALLLTGITFFSATEASAQRRGGRRVVVVRPVVTPYWGYRPFGWSGYGWYDRFGYDRFGYDSFAYNRYNQYVFDNSEEAARKAYNQGVKTGEEDGRKRKTFSYERSHYFKEAGFGNFGEVYRRSFARGYQAGYRVGADRAS